MIIGNGDIASVIKDRDGAIFFASGVSKSNETSEKEYDRERNLLLGQDKSKCIFYFSSITIDFTEQLEKSRYLRHKKEMEDLIKANFQNYNIIRIGNITWGNNPNTFLNFIKNKLENNEPVNIRRGELKYMLDKDQFSLIIDNLPLNGKNQISIFGKVVRVEDLI
jgi:hypothetical protein